MTFTTRPDLVGTFGAVSSTHWIASAVGMGILDHGGNAFDAAVATGLVLQVVEPHLNGPGGDLPAIFSRHGETPEALCAQGVAPDTATIARYRGEGLDHIPGSGLLATVVPGAFDGWMLMLRDYGTMPLDEVMAPAIHYSRQGHPLLARASRTIAAVAELFRTEWPSSAEVWLPSGSVPEPGSLFRNPDLAATWERIMRETEGQDRREARIDAARNCFYRGFVAERIGAFFESELMDSTGARHQGLLTADDMARWSAGFEPCTHGRYGGWEIFKTGAWGQGPVLLQALNILAQTGIETLDPLSPDFVHLATEAQKLAFADRETYYGDAENWSTPLDRLLSEDYAQARAAIIGEAASLELRPGRLAGLEDLADRAVRRAEAARARGTDAGVGTGEPSMGHLQKAEGDTVHLDVVDRWGNVVSATPSGGWLQSSPVVPGLGMPMNSRAQMFWLDDGLPASLAPRRRPRTTLSPSLARHDDGRLMAVGTPGGDQQDQWQLLFFLRLARDELSLQAIMDAPLFHTTHFQASFAPRLASPGEIVIEAAYGEETIRALRNRGHRVSVSPEWSQGRLTCAQHAPDGTIRAAATPRMMQAYAVAR